MTDKLTIFDARAKATREHLSLIIVGNHAQGYDASNECPSGWRVIECMDQQTTTQPPVARIQPVIMGDGSPTETVLNLVRDVKANAGEHLSIERVATLLEMFVDTFSIKLVLDALENVCQNKAAHLEANWQDVKSARVWIRNARIIATAAAKVRC